MSKPQLLVLHIDMNSAAFTADTVRFLVREAARLGYNALLWEVEDKIRWETCPAAVHPDAFSKSDFAAILSEARALGLAAIPLLQTFGHGEYVLSRPEYSSMREDPAFYDCYCSSSPAVADFQKRWIDEYLELFGDIPFFHLGGDEAYHFGRCPACSARDRLALYAEHLDAVSGAIRARGIRPCVWSDMVYANMKPRAKSLPLSRDFALCDWHYDTGDTQPPADAFRQASRLSSLGYDLFYTCATSSAGDDPFLVKWNRHAANASATAVYARATGALGFIVSSWSIRGAPKLAQIPLFDIAARVFRGESDAVPASLSAAFGPGARAALPAALGDWDSYLNLFHGIQWTNYKDSRLPPESLVADRLASLPAQDPDGFRNLRAALGRIAPALRAALASSRALPSTPVLDVWRAGAELKLDFLSLVERALANERGPALADSATALRPRVASYYAREQTATSSALFSRLVCDPLFDWARP